MAARSHRGLADRPCRLFSGGQYRPRRLAARRRVARSEGLDCLMAANAPDRPGPLLRLMRRAENRLYNWNFVRWLRGMVERLHRRFPELGEPRSGGSANAVYEFDDRYTAPRGGFRLGRRLLHPLQRLDALRAGSSPGLMVHALDDPFIGVGAAPSHENPPAFSRRAAGAMAATWAILAEGRGWAVAAGWTRGSRPGSVALGRQASPQ